MMPQQGQGERERSYTVKGKLDWQQVIFQTVNAVVQTALYALQFKGFDGYREAIVAGAQLIDTIMVTYRDMPEYREERTRIIFAEKLSDISPEYKEHPEWDGPIDEVSRSKKLIEAALVAGKLKGALGIETLITAEE